LPQRGEKSDQKKKKVEKEREGLGHTFKDTQIWYVIISYCVDRGQIRKKCNWVRKSGGGREERSDKSYHTFILMQTERTREGLSTNKGLGKSGGIENRRGLPHTTTAP